MSGDDGSFGRALAAAREARGLSQGDVAAQLRLHVRQVKAIEEEDLAALPEGAFVRGYVRNYAKLVDLPAESLLSLLNARLKPADPLHSQGGAAPISPLQRAPGEPFSGRIVIAGVLVALVILAAFGWWAMRADEQTRVSATPAPAPAAGPAPATPSTIADRDSPPAAPAGSATEPSIVAPAGAALPVTALRLTFRGPSWVEIRQADGTVLMSQTNAAGSTKTVEGSPPYLIVIGNASKVTLEHRGQPVDLAGFISRDDIARLRLE
jgi:cytoskeleton protein RodZ